MLYQEVLRVVNLTPVLVEVFPFGNDEAEFEECCSNGENHDDFIRSKSPPDDVDFNQEVEANDEENWNVSIRIRTQMQQQLQPESQLVQMLPQHLRNPALETGQSVLHRRKSLLGARQLSKPWSGRRKNSAPCLGDRWTGKPGYVFRLVMDGHTADWGGWVPKTTARVSASILL